MINIQPWGAPEVEAQHIIDMGSLNLHANLKAYLSLLNHLLSLKGLDAPQYAVHVGTVLQLLLSAWLASLDPDAERQKVKAAADGSLLLGHCYKCRAPITTSGRYCECVVVP